MSGRLRAHQMRGDRGKVVREEAVPRTRERCAESLEALHLAEVRLDLHALVSR